MKGGRPAGKGGPGVGIVDAIFIFFFLFHKGSQDS